MVCQTQQLNKIHKMKRTGQQQQQPEVSLEKKSRTSSSSPPQLVDSSRVQNLLSISSAEQGGAVVYWMSRDQRVSDNWALLYAAQRAQQLGVPLAVAFCLSNGFLGATYRHYAFMIRGLGEIEQVLMQMNVPFFLLRGSDPAQSIAEFVVRNRIRVLVADFSPLRIGVQWKNRVKEIVGEKVDWRFEFDQVDAHNVVPVWIASDKIEYAARTIRTKIHRQLDRYLVEIPEFQPDKIKMEWSGVDKPLKMIEWNEILKNLQVDRKVGEVSWIKPGESAAKEMLKVFVEQKLKNYDTKRNDPNLDALSNMSPYLHFGHISAQRVALEVKKHSRGSFAKSSESYLEELIVRRELSENYCFYNPDGYDRLDGLYPQFSNDSWAQKTLKDHEKDKRSHIYSLEELDTGKTHDKLWNASQLEMVHTGKMHGFMRMYWAKKILEWTNSPEEALKFSIYLNDRYELDGRDPNGYVGCAWSVAGLHDQGWKERPVFGKIRYMNYEGCARKFDVPGYIAKINRLIKK
jgi:deoxyribodipyrimidine photo-lyase